MQMLNLYWIWRFHLYLGGAVGRYGWSSSLLLARQATVPVPVPCLVPALMLIFASRSQVNYITKGGYFRSPAILLVPVLSGQEEVELSPGVCNSPTILLFAFLTNRSILFFLMLSSHSVLQAVSKQNTITLLLPRISCASLITGHFPPRGSLTLQHVPACSTGHSSAASWALQLVAFRQVLTSHPKNKSVFSVMFMALLYY